jgi:hypothetical protein
MAIMISISYKHPPSHVNQSYRFNRRGFTVSEKPEIWADVSKWRRPLSPGVRSLGESREGPGNYIKVVSLTN